MFGSAPAASGTAASASTPACGAAASAPFASESGDGVESASEGAASASAPGCVSPASSDRPMKSARNGVSGSACRMDWLIRSTEKRAITIVSRVEAQTRTK